jgi:hypothetical protein
MNVQELIEKLQQFDPKVKVKVKGWDNADEFIENEIKVKQIFESESRTDEYDYKTNKHIYEKVVIIDGGYF